METKIKALLVLIVLFQTQYGLGDVEVSLHLMSFNNPTMKDFYGGICDIFSRNCDQIFHICVDKFHGNDGREAEEQCAYYSDATGTFHQRNNIVFDHDLHGILNPIIFTIPDWQYGFLLKIGVWDADSFLARRERVDYIKYRYSLIPTPRRGVGDSSDYKVVRGIRRYDPTSLTFNITTYCADHFTTLAKMCDTYCKPTDDITGHYTCNKLGRKKCLPGWEDIHSDCTISINDCHDNHICKNGAICVDDHLTYRCQCPPHLKGPICDDGAGACKKKPCGAGLFCEEKSGGGFECNIKPRFNPVTSESTGISPLIIGLIVGALVFILIVILLIAIILRQKRKRRMKDRGTNAVAHTSTAGQQTPRHVGTSAHTNSAFSPIGVTDRDAVYQNQINGAVATTASSQTPFPHMTSSSTNTPGGAKAMEAGFLSPPPYRETDIPQTSGHHGRYDNFALPPRDNEDPPARPPPRGSTNRGVGTGTSGSGGVGGSRRTQVRNHGTGTEGGAVGGADFKDSRGVSVKAMADKYDKPISLIY